MDFDQPFAAEAKPVAFRVLFAIKYQGMTGSLMLSMIETRPNIAFATSIASHFAKKNPSHLHIEAVKTILKYPPKGQKIEGLFTGKEPLLLKDTLILSGLAIKRAEKSTSVYIFMLTETNFREDDITQNMCW